MTRAPHLWGGFAQYMYLLWNSVLHRVPEGLSPELAGVVTPMANGIQWALFDCEVGYDSKVLIQGPGQQGLCNTIASRTAGGAVDHRGSCISLRSCPAWKCFWLVWCC